eukprot:15337109-Ditylum_brightwellii.AAC.1
MVLGTNAGMTLSIEDEMMMGSLMAWHLVLLLAWHKSASGGHWRWLQAGLNDDRKLGSRDGRKLGIKND